MALSIGSKVSLNRDLDQDQFVLGMGQVTYDDVGVVISIHYGLWENQPLYVVTFPNSPTWRGLESELVIAERKKMKAIL